MLKVASSEKYLQVKKFWSKFQLCVHKMYASYHHTAGILAAENT